MRAATGTRVVRRWSRTSSRCGALAIEFGPAELVDSLLVRPAAFYVGPQIFGNVVVGWIFGKLVSDVAF